MRIGVNALYLIPGRVGGTEIYLRNVVSALSASDRVNEYFVFRNRESGPDLTPPCANFHDCPQPVSGISRPARVLYEQTALPLLCRRLRIEVLFNGGFTAPMLRPCPMATVFHDLQYERHPEFFRKWDLPFWRILLPASAKRSDRIVVLSETVKADLLHYYRLAAERIAVIPHGIEPEFARIAQRRASQLPNDNLILSVSTLHPHKNLDALLTAFAQFHQRNPTWRLCLAGLKGFEAGKIEARRQELHLQDAVTITGWIPRDELYSLFATASAFIYPSRFEGFGIPVLEALAAGIPTACSRLSSLVEIADGAVRFFEPDSIDDMVQALHDVTEDSAARKQRLQEGLQKASRYSWERSARGLIAVFEDCVKPSRAQKTSTIDAQ